MTPTPRLVAAVLLLAAAGCGDNRSQDDPSTSEADAAAADDDGGSPDAGGPDAGGQPDGGGEPAVVVFDNADGAFVWTPTVQYEENITRGDYLDLTLPAASQTGTVSPSAILFFRKWPSYMSTYGGMWFRSRAYEPGDGGAAFAAGEDFILYGTLNGDADDLTTVPPLGKSAGDTVGPDDRWITYDGEHRGVRAAHYQDDGGMYAPDQVWFTGGTIGVRFEADDGVHYGFVELAYDPTDDRYGAFYTPLRWGYATEPDTPLVIPP